MQTARPDVKSNAARPDGAEVSPAHWYKAFCAAQVLRDYIGAFTLATGLSLEVWPHDASSAVIPFAECRSRFCALLGENRQGCVGCALEHARVRQLAAQTLEFQRGRCCAGMAYAAVPVVVDRGHLATLVAGQVLLEKPTPQRFARIIARWPQGCAGAELVTLRGAYLQSRAVTEGEFDAMVRLLLIFAGQMTHAASHLLFLPGETDPPSVSLAKDFARQHASEPIAMPDAARHVHLSACYFCKIFKKSTGVTFTEYVSRVRVEMAKRLLEDARKRVSEIAFDSGFESIPHFNRVFKRYAGMAPTAYRASLREPASAPDG